MTCITGWGRQIVFGASSELQSNLIPFISRLSDNNLSKSLIHHQPLGRPEILLCLSCNSLYVTRKRLDELEVESPKRRHRVVREWQQ